MRKLSLLALLICSLILSGCKGPEDDPFIPPDPPIVHDEYFKFDFNTTLQDKIASLGNVTNLDKEIVLELLDILSTNDEVINFATIKEVDKNVPIGDNPYSINNYSNEIEKTISRYQNEDNTLLLLDSYNHEVGFKFVSNEDNLVREDFDVNTHTQINRDMTNDLIYMFEKRKGESLTHTSKTYSDLIYESTLIFVDNSTYVDRAEYMIANAEEMNVPVQLSGNISNGTLSIDIVIDQAPKNTNHSGFLFEFHAVVDDGVLIDIYEEETVYYLPLVDGEENDIASQLIYDASYAVKSDLNSLSSENIFPFPNI